MNANANISFGNPRTSLGGGDEFLAGTPNVFETATKVLKSNASASLKVTAGRVNWEPRRGVVKSKLWRRLMELIGALQRCW